MSLLIPPTTHHLSEMVNTACDLSAGSTDHPEYRRGQAELIRDLLHIGEDFSTEDIAALIDARVARAWWAATGVTPA